MEIKKELIPKDKLKVLTVKDIHNIVDFLFEPLKIDIDKTEMPKHLYSSHLDKPENRTFSGRLQSVRDGKALFLPKEEEYDKIAYYDEVIKIQNFLFKLKRKQEEYIKIGNTETRPQIKKEILEQFKVIFEGKNTIKSIEAELKEKLFTKHYVLAYILDAFASDKGLPSGEKVVLERIGNEIMGEGKGNTFYKQFNKISNRDLNSENTLIKIGGNNWRNIVIELSKNPKVLEKYLQSKQL